MCCNRSRDRFSLRVTGGGRVQAVHRAARQAQPTYDLLRNSLDSTTWKERKPSATALRPIYTAANADAALVVLDDFERGPWGVRFPTVVAVWRRAWTHVILFGSRSSTGIASRRRTRRMLRTENVHGRSSGTGTTRNERVGRRRTEAEVRLETTAVRPMKGWET
jgi:transposase-like protein